jgi:hypothetical protein
LAYRSGALFDERNEFVERREVRSRTDKAS